MTQEKIIQQHCVLQLFSYSYILTGFHRPIVFFLLFSFKEKDNKILFLKMKKKYRLLPVNKRKKIYIYMKIANPFAFFLFLIYHMEIISWERNRGEALLEQSWVQCHLIYTNKYNNMEMEAMLGFCWKSIFCFYVYSILLFFFVLSLLLDFRFSSITEKHIFRLVSNILILILIYF